MAKGCDRPASHRASNETRPRAEGPSTPGEEDENGGALDRADKPHGQGRLVGAGERFDEVTPPGRGAVVAQRGRLTVFVGIPEPVQLVVQIIAQLAHRLLCEHDDVDLIASSLGKRAEMALAKRAKWRDER